MNTHFIEESRTIKVSESCEVFVAGGGIAGVSAALAAARNGKKVILAEREYGLGGMATLGLIAIYLPLCDGMGNQVIKGISEELLRLSIVHGASEGYPYPAAWLDGGTKEERTKQRFIVQFNPVLFALEMEKLLIREGVEILYGTLIADVHMAGEFIDSVIIENKSGRSAIHAGMFIDATGDADLAYRAGVECSLLPQKNALASWYYYTGSDRKVLLSMFGLADIRPGKAKDGGYNKTEETISSTRFSGVDGKELSLAVQEAHSLMLEDILGKNEKDKAYQPVSMSSIPLVRMSRKICGAETLRIGQDHEMIEDSIGMTGDWTKRGPVYEIPFGSLYSAKVPNLLTAGRCISTDNEVWNVTRVIPPCAVTGEAAGTAAAMCSDLRKISVKELQSRLKAQNVMLHCDEIDTEE